METQRVIKAESMRELGKKVLFDFADFQQQCNSHISDVTQQAQQVVSSAQAQANVIAEQAHKEGYQAGYATGMQTADQEIQNRADAQTKTTVQQELASAKQTLISLAQSIQDAKNEWLQHWESETIKLSTCIAEKILRAELETRPNLSLEMIRHLLEIVSSEPRLLVRVHPDDADLLNRSEQSSQSLEQFSNLLEIRSDPSLSRGDCVCVSEKGHLDGRIKTQLDQLTAELVGHEVIEND